MEKVERYDPQVDRYLTLGEFISECYGGHPDVLALTDEWNTLAIKPIGYDSKDDTIAHIKRVAELLNNSAKVLNGRAKWHDYSKLKSPEKEVFDEFTPKLRGCTYGSEEYKGFLRSMNVALVHHYANNSHHPEHYPNGVNDFDLFDLVEMLMDWKAATERHEDGDIYRSLDINRLRFGLSDQIYSILRNTAQRLKWAK